VRVHRQDVAEERQLIWDRTALREATAAVGRHRGGRVNEAALQHIHRQQEQQYERVRLARVARHAGYLEHANAHQVQPRHQYLVLLPQLTDLTVWPLGTDAAALQQLPDRGCPRTRAKPSPQEWI
jgi:hypothetical protein